MGDFSIVQSETDLSYDIDFQGIDFVIDEGLETSMIVSLFTDRRVEQEELPATETGKRGFWGDTLEDTETGSKLWLLDREKQTNNNLRRARDFTSQALQIYLDENVAREINVDTSYPRISFLRIDVEFIKPTGEEVFFRFDKNWEAEFNESN